MSVIGIIDDDNNDIGTLKRTILSILKKNNIDICIEFKEYDLSSNRGEISDEIVKEILNDIINYQISILIIDHKIIIKDKLLSGAEIFEKIRKVAPDFPTIIMTNVVDDSKKNNYVDPDKVYAKSLFDNKDIVQNLINKGLNKGELAKILNTNYVTITAFLGNIFAN